MKLFISYARVDKGFCIQIVETLEVHDVWYDQRLYAGQHWWREILQRLDWCDGFIYLLSVESIASPYCQREFELAQRLGRHIFPALIDEGVTLPPALRDLHYVDFTKGLTTEAVMALLNAILIAERKTHHASPAPATGSLAAIAPDEMKLSASNPGAVITAAAGAMEKGQFDQAVFLLRQAKANNFQSRFIDLDALLQEALVGLERQAYLREAEREYRQIAELIKYKQTRRLGCEALRAFREAYPEYDPQGLAELCEKEGRPSFLAGFRRRSRPEKSGAVNLPNLEWCEIPEGDLQLLDSEELGRSQQSPRVPVPAFLIGKYPVTNIQYQEFLNDPHGYADKRWWQYSPHAVQWHSTNPASLPSKYDGDERPREMVCWYAALAFCHWLSDRLEAPIMLPTEHQWMRAARGDDNRVYPWGDLFDFEYCNTAESRIKMTSLVIRYGHAASPFGVFDMAGNVWEWCLNPQADPGDSPEISSDADRAIHGGSFIGPALRSKINARFYIKPNALFSSIGFRVVQLLAP